MNLTAKRDPALMLEDIYDARVEDGAVSIVAKRADGLYVEWRIPAADFARFGVPWGRAPLS